LLSGREVSRYALARVFNLLSAHSHVQVIDAIFAHDGDVIVDSDDAVVAERASVGDSCEVYVRAAFDYDGEEDHLALKVGDRVRIVQKHDSGW
jgi:hypothetical protein